MEAVGRGAGPQRGAARSPADKGRGVEDAYRRTVTTSAAAVAVTRHCRL